MLKIFSSETFMPASTQSGVGIGEANSDAMFREQADESDAFLTTISFRLADRGDKLVADECVDERPERGNIVVIRNAPKRRLPAGFGPREAFSLQPAFGRSPAKRWEDARRRS